MENEDNINPLRRLFQRKRQPLDERLPDGTSVDDLVRQAQRGNPIDSGGGQGVPLAQPAAQPTTRPRTFRDVLQQRMAQPTPQNPIPQAGMTPAAPTTDLGQGSTFSPDGTGTSRDRRTQPRDYVADDQAYLRELQQHKGPFWKRLAAASVRAGQAASHQDISPILTSRERDMAEGQARLGQDLSVGREQVQMQTFKNRQAQQDEREVNNALTQYNRLEHFDPDDPADAGFAQYFRERGLTLPKKDKYHRPIASWVNGRLILTDNKGTRQALEGNDSNKPLVDKGRVPNEQGLTPQQQSTVTTAGANRAAANTRSANQIAAANQRAANVQAGQNQRAGMRGQGAGAKPVKVDAQTRKYALNLVQQVNDANDAIGRFDKGQRSDIPLPPDMAAKRQELVNKAKTIVERLKSANAGYEAGTDARGYPYAKPMEGGAAPQSAPSGVTEAQIRAAAAAKGLDPDTAVQRARARKLIP